MTLRLRKGRTLPGDIRGRLELCPNGEGIACRFPRYLLCGVGAVPAVKTLYMLPDSWEHGL